MSSLDSFALQYEDLNPNTRKGGKDIKPMSKTTQTASEKPAKKYAKTRGEHAKDIIIAILVTSIVAFVGGMYFQGKQNSEVKNAVSAAQQAMAPKAEAAPVSK